VATIDVAATFLFVQRSNKRNGCVALSHHLLTKMAHALMPPHEIRAFGEKSSLARTNVVDL
jgi:hypothetical protein